MSVVIGAKGLEEVTLVIPQSTSLTFDVIHEDENGEAIDHSQSTAKMAFQTKDKSRTWHMDECCTCTSEKIRVTIPATITESLPVSKLVWDLFVITTLGEQIRLCFGDVQMADTYAMDE